MLGTPRRARVARALKRNLDIYVGIFVASLVSAFSIFGLTDAKVVSSAILAVLALMSFILLLARRQYDEIERLVSPLRLREYLPNEVFQRDFDRALVKARLAEASTAAWFWGVSLLRTFLTLQDQIETAIQRGLQVRILVLRPGSASVRMASFRSLHSDEAEINQQINILFSRLGALGNGRGQDSIQVRTVDYLPPYSMFAFDPQQPEGRTIVRLFPFRVPNDTRPFFELSAKHNAELHSFFVEQFQSAWEASEQVDLSSLSRPDIRRPSGIAKT